MSNTFKQEFEENMLMHKTANEYRATAERALNMRFPASLQANLGLGLVTITREAASALPYNTIMRALHAYARDEEVTGLQVSTHKIGEYLVTEVSL